MCHHINGSADTETHATHGAGHRSSFSTAALLGDGVDGVLEDVALAACHCEMLARASVDRLGKPRNGLPQRGFLGPTHRQGVQARSYGGWSPNGISGLTDPRSI
jgi:hypothetical protein